MEEEEEEEEEEAQSDVNSSGDRQGTYVSRERSLLRGKGGSRRVSIEDKKTRPFPQNAFIV